MSVEPLNTIPIVKFIQTVKAAEASSAKEIRLDLTTAKNLAFALGILSSRLHGDLEKLVAERGATNNEVISVKMDGGTNWK